MQPYDKHTSWVKSPWNYVNFLPESPLNSLDIDLEKLLNLVIHFWLKSGKVRELESQKARESQGILLKRIAGKPWRIVTKFCRILSRKSLFAKSKLTNLKDSGGVVGSEKYTYQNSFCLEFFWYSAYSEKEAGSALHVLCQAIKIRVT